VLEPGASEDEIQGLIDRHKLIFIKPVFKGRRRQEGRVRADRQGERSQDRLAGEGAALFVEHRHGNTRAKANGVTFEAGVPAEHEVSSLSATPRNSAPQR
jgi:hypothetical protein